MQTARQALPGRPEASQENTTGMMQVTPFPSRLLLLLALVWQTNLLQAGEWSGYAQSEVRLFPHSPADPTQAGSGVSLAFQPEYYTAWSDGKQSLTVEPFYRWDQHDGKRTHGDVRELVWLKASDTWELRAGVSKVFWGVAESQHLVDIINQTDLVENIDQEDKLGQPMINLTLVRDWGNLDLFVLPWFRERTFPGRNGRLRTIPRVDTGDAVYESGSKQKHVDYAIRWSDAIGDWDIGVAHFIGTARDPRLFPGVDDSGEPVLIPRYDLINQTSIDLQATKGSWLWKLEALTRSGQGGRYQAMVGGFEYTRVGVFDTAADLGYIAEYHYDTRDETAPTPFEDDIMVGLRLTLNDIPSTEVLMGVIADRDGSGVTWNLEASRRIGESWTIDAEARAFSHISSSDPLYSYRDDDYLQIALERHF
jgi:hypothetical protein